jgi:hypothetical protein
MFHRFLPCGVAATTHPLFPNLQGGMFAWRSLATKRHYPDSTNEKIVLMFGCSSPGCIDYSSWQSNSN